MLLHTDRHGFSCPVNFRRVDKAEGKTKHAHFRDMVAEVLGRGLRPADRWSSGVENLKFLKDQGPGFLIALEKNRVVSEEAHVSLPGVRAGPAREGQGRASAQSRLRDGVSHGGQARHREALRAKRPAKKSAFGHFKHGRALPWKIECYHHALKEVCHVCRFFVRGKGVIHNHVFCSLRAFLKPEKQRSQGTISSWYPFKRHLADAVVTNFIQQRTRTYGA